MTATEELLGNAQHYAAGFAKGDLPMPPAERVTVVACMDARLNPYGLWASPKVMPTSSAMPAVW